jgi:hypothetical protein
MPHDNQTSPEQIYWALALLLFVCLPAIVAINVWHYRLMRDGRWHPWNGRMCRLQRCEWQYRAQTEAEDELPEWL